MRVTKSGEGVGVGEAKIVWTNEFECWFSLDVPLQVLTYAIETFKCFFFFIFCFLQLLSSLFFSFNFFYFFILAFLFHSSFDDYFFISLITTRDLGSFRFQNSPIWRFCFLFIQFCVYFLDGYPFWRIRLRVAADKFVNFVK